MKHEYSCGAVLFSKTESGIKYVLVVEKNGNIGFPKGHMEKGETEHECALREIREETGINACIISGFTEKIRYMLKNGHIKHVTFFAAFYDGLQEPVHTDEVNGYKLVEFDDAMRLLSYKLSRDVLLKFRKSGIVNSVK